MSFQVGLANTNTAAGNDDLSLPKGECTGPPRLLLFAPFALSRGFPPLSVTT